MRRSRGYILPMTLVLLALAALVLARVCRRDMQDSLRATADSDALQKKWGMLSCQSTFLPGTAGILDAASHVSGHATGTLRSQVVLGGQAFDLFFADEGAKANLNVLYRRHDAQEVEKAVRLGTRGGRTQIPVRLRPLGDRRHANGDDEKPPVFGSFGQIYDESNVHSALGTFNATQDITCWGNGKLNWRLASSAALEAVLHGDAALARQIAALQARQTPGTPISLAASLKIPPAQMKQTSELLSDSSNCWSLWVLCGAGATPHARLGVQELRDDGHPRVLSFQW